MWKDNALNQNASNHFMLMSHVRVLSFPAFSYQSGPSSPWPNSDFFLESDPKSFATLSTSHSSQVRDPSLGSGTWKNSIFFGFILQNKLVLFSISFCKPNASCRLTYSLSLKNKQTNKNKKYMCSFLCHQITCMFSNGSFSC